MCRSQAITDLDHLLHTPGLGLQSVEQTLLRLAGGHQQHPCGRNETRAPGVGARCLYTVRREAAQRMGGDDGDIQFQQAALDPVLFKGIVGPGGNICGRGDIQHLDSPGNQALGQYAAHVVVVIVEHHHGRRQHSACHHIIRREYGQVFQPRERLAQHTAQAIVAPTRTGGDKHVAGFNVENVLHFKAAFTVDLDIAQTAQGIHPVIDHPRPARQPR